MTKTLSKTYIVREDQLANTLGSGDMQVLGTPALVCMMENTCMTLAAEGLDSSDDTTVGSQIATTHERPSVVGATIEVVATLTEVDGRKLSFDVVAKDNGTVVGRGTHTRFVVNRQKFLSKLISK